MRNRVLSLCLFAAAIVGCESGSTHRPDGGVDEQTGGNGGSGTGGARTGGTGGARTGGAGGTATGGTGGTATGGTGGVATGGTGGVATGGAGGAATGGSGGTAGDGGVDMASGGTAGDGGIDMKIVDAPVVVLVDAADMAPADMAVDMAQPDMATPDMAADTTPDTTPDTATPDTTADTTPDTTPDMQADTAPAVTPAFKSIDPCTLESGSGKPGYAAWTSATVITFDPTNGYSSACLRVKKDTTVKFKGDFQSHPLVARAATGAVGTTANPVHHSESTHDEKEFAVTLTVPGFYPYNCAVHGAPTMTGVIWVTE